MTQPRGLRSRRKSGQVHPASVHPTGTPTSGISRNTGPLATAAWLLARGLTPTEARWYAEILLSTSDRRPDDNSPILLRIELFSEEWGFSFRHDDRTSWIRITDVPFVHGRDDHGLLAAIPPLQNFGSLVHTLEARFELRFVIDAAVIRTSLFGAEPAIRAWIDAW